MQTCSTCGTENPNKNNFCSKCGAPFESEGEAEPISGTPDSSLLVKPVTSSDNGSYNYDRSQYNYNNTTQKSGDGDYSVVALLSLILAITGFFINPLYIFSVTALILGIIGAVNSKEYKNLATIGWILAIASFITQFLLDIFCTLGLGIFC